MIDQPIKVNKLRLKLVFQDQECCREGNNLDLFPLAKLLDKIATIRKRVRYNRNSYRN